MTRRIFVGGVVLLLIGLVAFSVKTAWDKRPFSLMYQPGASPTAEPSTSPMIQACQADQLTALAEFEGAAGSIYGTFTLTNTADYSCAIDGENHLQLHYDSKVKSIKVTPDQPTVKTTYLLEPNQAIISTVRLPDGPQCSSAISPVTTTYTYALPNDQSVTFKDSTGQQNFTINACSSSKEITQVSLKTWSNPQ